MKLITTVTFIPWILYFIEIMLYRINVLEKINDRDKYYKEINKKLFNSINVKEIGLFFLFNIFMQYDNIVVLNILFPAIYIYILVDFFHTLAKDCKKIKNKWLMVQSVIAVIVIIGYFLLTDHLYTTYNSMFLVSILSSFLVYAFDTVYYSFKSDKK